MLVLKSRTGQEKGTETLVIECGEPGINRYELFLKETTVKNKYRLEKTRGIIRETDTDYVRTFTVMKGTTGTVLDLRSPQFKAVSIFGQNQIELGGEGQPEFNVKDPYQFALHCFDNSSRELDTATRMNFKRTSAAGSGRAWRACYGDLSQGYLLPLGVYLQGDDALALEVLNPDIDIERIELSVEADVW